MVAPLGWSPRAAFLVCPTTPAGILLPNPIEGEYRSDRQRSHSYQHEGRSSGALVAGIIAVLVILLAVWFFTNNGATTDGDRDVDVNVTVPAAPATTN